MAVQNNVFVCVAGEAVADMRIKCVLTLPLNLMCISPVAATLAVTEHSQEMRFKSNEAKRIMLPRIDGIWNEGGRYCYRLCSGLFFFGGGGVSVANVHGSFTTEG